MSSQVHSPLAAASAAAATMDLNIHLERGRIFTRLHAKPMALHLYIPPSSCHAPGITTGLIYGHFHRLFTLCSHEKDIEQEIYLFFNRLLDRGYSLPHLIPLFITAEHKARAYCTQQLHLHRTQRSHSQTRQQLDTPTTPRGVTKNNTGVFLHLQYHPANPPAPVIQHLWRRVVSTPHGETPLHQLRNRDGHPIDIRKLTIAYSRAPNLGNLRD